MATPTCLYFVIEEGLCEKYYPQFRTFSVLVNTLVGFIKN